MEGMLINDPENQVLRQYAAQATMAMHMDSSRIRRPASRLVVSSRIAAWDTGVTSCRPGCVANRQHTGRTQDK